MRKFVVLLASTLFIGSLFLAGCSEEKTPPATSKPSPQAKAAQTTPTPSGPVKITLKFVSEKPPTHADITKLFPSFFKMVEKAANGKYVFDIQYFPVNTLLAPADVYDGIVKGVADVGQSSTAFTATRFPVTVTVSQPGIAPPKSVGAVAKAVMELNKKYKPKEFSDTHLLYLYPTGPGWMHAKSPITTVEQMKGKKTRVSGVVQAIKLIGGDPIAIPMGEVFEAAQKGIIEVLVSPAETLEGWKHAELFDYSTFVPFIYPSDVFFVTMNQKKWDSLPEDLKKAFDSVSLDAALLGSGIWTYLHEHGKEYAKKKPKGHQFLEMPAAEVSKILELIKPIRTQFITYLNEKGLPGEEIVNETKRVMDECNKLEYPTWQP